MMQGWVKLHRKIWEWPYSKDSDFISVWLFLITNATHKPYDLLFAGSRITLRPGQLITSRKTIEEKTGVNTSKVERILKKLKSEHQIEQQTSNKSRLISILNWGEYQDCEHQSEQQVNNNRTTSEQQVNTNKNINNNNNINNSSFVTHDDANAQSYDHPQEITEMTLSNYYEKNSRDEFEQYCFDWAIKKKLTSEQAQDQFNEFNEYYLSTALKKSKAIRKDWKATFQRWINQFIKFQKQKNNQNGNTKDNLKLAEHIHDVFKTNLNSQKSLDFDYEKSDLENKSVFLSLINRGFGKEDFRVVLEDLETNKPKRKIYSWAYLYNYFPKQ